MQKCPFCQDSVDFLRVYLSSVKVSASPWPASRLTPACLCAALILWSEAHQRRVETDPPRCLHNVYTGGKVGKRCTEAALKRLRKRGLKEHEMAQSQRFSSAKFIGFYMVKHQDILVTILIRSGIPIRTTPEGTSGILCQLSSEAVLVGSPCYTQWQLFGTVCWENWKQEE